MCFFLNYFYFLKKLGIIFNWKYLNVNYFINYLVLILFIIDFMYEIFVLVISKIRLHFRLD